MRFRAQNALASVLQPRLRWASFLNAFLRFFVGKKIGESKGKREEKGEQLVRLGGRLLPGTEGNGRSSSVSIFTSSFVVNVFLCNVIMCLFVLSSHHFMGDFL